jgi:hypothetical protein
MKSLDNRSAPAVKIAHYLIGNKDREDTAPQSKIDKRKSTKSPGAETAGEPRKFAITSYALTNEEKKVNVFLSALLYTVKVSLTHSLIYYDREYE